MSDCSRAVEFLPGRCLTPATDGPGFKQGSLMMSNPRGSYPSNNKQIRRDVIPVVQIFKLYPDHPHDIPHCIPSKSFFFARFLDGFGELPMSLDNFLEQHTHTHTSWEFLPSGKRSQNYGKSPFFMGQSTISMAMFNSKQQTLPVYPKLSTYLQLIICHRYSTTSPQRSLHNLVDGPPIDAPFPAGNAHAKRATSGSGWLQSWEWAENNRYMWLCTTIQNNIYAYVYIYFFFFF